MTDQLALFHGVPGLEDTPPPPPTVATEDPLTAVVGALGGSGQWATVNDLAQALLAKGASPSLAAARRRIQRAVRAAEAATGQRIGRTIGGRGYVVRVDLLRSVLLGDAAPVEDHGAAQRIEALERMMAAALDRIEALQAQIATLTNGG